MFNLHRWHSFQIIAVVGIVTALLVQGLLILVGKDVARMWALYPCWIFFFTIGWLLKRKEDAEHVKEDTMRAQVVNHLSEEHKQGEVK
jgi:L-asparagine transporter-like permease